MFSLENHLKGILSQLWNRILIDFDFILDKTGTKIVIPLIYILTKNVNFTASNNYLLIKDIFYLFYDIEKFEKK